MAEKGNAVIENVLDSFVSGIKSKTLYTMIASGVGLLAVIGWSVIIPRLKPGRHSSRKDAVILTGLYS